MLEGQYLWDNSPDKGLSGRRPCTIINGTGLCHDWDSLPAPDVQPRLDSGCQAAARKFSSPLKRSAKSGGGDLFPGRAMVARLRSQHCLSEKLPLVSCSICTWVREWVACDDGEVEDCSPQLAAGLPTCTPLRVCNGCFYREGLQGCLANGQGALLPPPFWPYRPHSPQSPLPCTSSLEGVQPSEYWVERNISAHMVSS